MGRPKEFDPDSALNSAVALFWEQGYEATSIEQLVDRMGISRASLYNAFGGKHDLFLAALERYDQAVVRQGLRTLEIRGDPMEILQRYFEKMLRFNLKMGLGRGCLMTNAASELAARDNETAKRVRASLQRRERALARVIERGQELGQIRKQTDASCLARYLNGIICGLSAVGKLADSSDPLEEIVEVALNCIRA